jgi:hypothetical protein
LPSSSGLHKELWGSEKYSNYPRDKETIISVAAGPVETREPATQPNRELTQPDVMGHSVA